MWSVRFFVSQWVRSHRTRKDTWDVSSVISKITICVFFYTKHTDTFSQHNPYRTETKNESRVIKRYVFDYRLWIIFWENCLLSRESPTVCSYCNRMLLCSTHYSSRVTLLSHFVKFHRLSRINVGDFISKWWVVKPCHCFLKTNQTFKCHVECLVWISLHRSCYFNQKGKITMCCLWSITSWCCSDGETCDGCAWNVGSSMEL